MTNYIVLELQQKAFEVFKTLTAPKDNTNPNDPSIFGSRSGFWSLGCVYDTLLDYMLMAIGQKTISPQEAWEISGKVLDGYNSNHGCWYDDFAWWGILAAKAFGTEYDDVFGPYKAQFQEISMANWDKVQNGKEEPEPGKKSFGAPNVFDKCDKNLFQSVAPRFQGGVWQYDIYTGTDPYDTNCSLNDTFSPIPLVSNGNDGIYPTGARTLGPYQQSVMIGLYLQFSQILSAHNKVDKQFAINIFEFIYNWTNNPSVTADEKLLNTFGSNYRGIIRERVSTYANGERVYLYGNGDAAWCGDQGLFMGGLLEYYKAHQTEYAPELLMKICLGTITDMVISTPVNGQNKKVINYWYPAYNTWAIMPLGLDPGDYTSGIGVFFRNLMHCWNYDSIPGLPKLHIQRVLREPQYWERIMDTVDAAYTKSLPDVLPDGLSKVNPVFEEFNRLSVLTCAIQMLLTPLSLEDKNDHKKNKEKDKVK